jgi:2,4-dichlorophenol 6-monooxygenase
VSEAIERQAEHFDMLGLQIGFTYEQGAILPDGSEKPAVANPVREFVPSSRPGARLPHGWLGEGSSLDLIGLDELTLLVGSDGGAWVEAAGLVDAEIRCVRVGADVPDPHGWWGRVAGMGVSGALLVRPDQHIAFRARGAVSDPLAALRAAVDAALGRDWSRRRALVA